MIDFDWDELDAKIKEWESIYDFLMSTDNQYKESKMLFS